MPVVPIIKSLSVIPNPHCAFLVMLAFVLAGPVTAQEVREQEMEAAGEDVVRQVEGEVA